LQEKAQAQSAAPESTNKIERAQSKADRQSRLAERRPLLKESEQLESQLAKWHAEKQQYDTRLASPDIYEQANKAELQTLLKAQAAINQTIEQAEERWLVLQDQLEALPQL
jgi:ATP-binding cassette subfamily F protein 3